MVTIKDIAKEAGVSFTTVSNVIHGNTKRVSPATIAKIEKIMKDMHYVPNMGARMLVRNQSNIIGVIANDLTEPSREGIQSPFMAEILGTMEKEIRRNGYYMMLCFSDSTDEIEKLLHTWNVAGILTVSLGTEGSRQLGEKITVPAVFTDCYFRAEEEYCNVGTEDEQGAYEMTSYLLSLGHREILFVSDVDRKNGETACDAGIMRELGFVRAMKDAGIRDGERRIVSCGNTEEEKKELFERLMQRKSEITALVFCNDYFAVEGMDYFRHQGIRIPEDFSVTGFDDIDMARLTSPRLTTVHQGVSEKGRLAVKQLIARMEGKELAEKDIKLPVRLVIRESVQDISGSKKTKV